MPSIFVAGIIVGYLPFIGAGWRVFGFLPGYAGEEGFDAGGAGFYLLSLLRYLPPLTGLSGQAYVIGAAALLVALAAAIVRTRDNTGSPFAAAAVLATTFTIFVSPHYPWYFAWLIPFLCLIPDPAVIYMTLASFLMYLTWLGDAPNQVLKMKAGIYVPTFVLCTLMVWWRRRRKLSADYADYTDGKNRHHIGP